MKLFVIASLIAISAAARLEHLERSYLPPTQSSFGSNSFGANSGSHGSFGANSGSHGSFGANSGSHESFGANSGSHGSFGANSGSHGSFGANSGSHGSFGANSGSFGANPGSFGATNGFGSSSGRLSALTHSDGSSFPGATSNQYLPPDQGSSASSGSPQFSGSLQGFGNQRYQAQQYSAPQPASSSGKNQYTIPSTQYGTPQGSSFGTPQGSSFGTPQGSSSFGAQTFGSRYQSQSNQFGAASRQYLAPKATPSFQNSPQQSFDEQTGYHY